MEFYVIMGILFTILPYLNLVIVAILIVLFKMASKYDIHNQIFANINSNSNTAYRYDNDEEFADQNDYSTIIDNASGIIQTKLLRVTNYTSVNAKNSNDNFLASGNARLTLTNYHASMYPESLFPTQIEIVDCKAMLAMWKQLLIYTIAIRILTNLLTVIHVYAFEEYKYSVRKLYLYDTTLANVYCNGETKFDFESTIINQALFTSCGREARTKYVNTTNTLFANTKEYAERNGGFDTINDDETDPSGHTDVFLAFEFKRLC